MKEKIYIKEKVKKIGVTSKEMVLKGSIQHRNISESVNVTGIIDTGSGFSYLILYEGENPPVPMRRLEQITLAVQLANESLLGIQQQVIHV